MTGIKQQTKDNMAHAKYILQTPIDDEEEKNEKEEREEQRSSFLLKKMEQLFLQKRAVYLWGIIDDRSAKDIVSKLMLLDADKPGEEIKFYINSPGGMVTSGMVMYDTIKLIKSPVSTICMGLAASMGSILLSAGVKGRRFVYPHAEIMIHQPSLGGYFQATSADIEIQANQMRKTKEIGAKILAQNCGKTVEQIMKDFDRDYWMDAKEAVTYGIVDKIIEKL
ncbi:MAG TPA: ATP-dependent Clp protease proteolytic subunit [Chitinophagaceae bacterium]|jgi:ATP-dependent Clp protease protease subunit